MRYAKIRTMDISNGIGVRATLFVQGCEFKCKNCFNKETWDFNGGELWNGNIKERFIKMGNRSYYDGYSILGGECLNPKNIEEVTSLCKEIKERTNKTIWIWTGYKYEDYVRDKDIIKHIDILVDGLYVEELRNPQLKYRGSSNQRVLDIRKTIGTDSIVELI